MFFLSTASNRMAESHLDSEADTHYTNEVRVRREECENACLTCDGPSRGCKCRSRNAVVSPAGIAGRTKKFRAVSPSLSRPKESDVETEGWTNMAFMNEHSRRSPVFTRKKTILRFYVFF